jgi:hypothetical protein
MSELPLDDGPGISAAAHDAARGHVVYLTEHGERLAAIVPAEFAALLEGMTADQARELLEDLADGAAARQALEEPGEDIPAEQVWTELDLTRPARPPGTGWRSGPPRCGRSANLTGRPPSGSRPPRKHYEMTPAQQGRRCSPGRTAYGVSGSGTTGSYTPSMISDALCASRQ